MCPTIGKRDERGEGGLIGEGSEWGLGHAVQDAIWIDMKPGVCKLPAYQLKGPVGGSCSEHG